MQVTLEPRTGYLRASVRKRESVEEIRSVIPQILHALKAHGRDRLLVVSEASDPVFRVQQYDLGGWFERFATLGIARVALVSDSNELFASHQYIELLAVQRGVPLRAFRDEAAAQHWLLS